VAEPEYIEFVVGRTNKTQRRRLVRREAIVELIEYLGETWEATGVVIQGIAEPLWVRHSYNDVKRILAPNTK
jgi:hypothetical protein